MGTAAGIRFKADDIWDVPDDGRRYEVIEGDLVVTTAPDLDHQYPITELIYLIRGYLRRTLHEGGPGGQIFTAPVGVIFDDENGLQPDLVYVSRARSGILTRRGIRGVPDLVVEVLSAGTEARDRGVKLRRYAVAGVPHYWLVDPTTRSLEAYRAAASGYERTGAYGPGTTFEPELFPGLEIPVDELWP